MTLEIRREGPDSITGYAARTLDIETQDTNVPACRLYAASGYALVEVIPRAYGDATNEARLLWSKSLV
jgi:hypothetical protein